MYWHARKLRIKENIVNLDPEITESTSHWLAAVQLPAPSAPRPTQPQESQSVTNLSFPLDLPQFCFGHVHTLHSHTDHPPHRPDQGSLPPQPLPPSEPNRLILQLVEGTIATLLLLPYNEMLSMTFCSCNKHQNNHLEVRKQASKFRSLWSIFCLTDIVRDSL